MIEKIVSGGQTGADRGALRAALKAQFPYGGWIPRDRLADDGQVPGEFTALQCHRSPGYPPRTIANIRDSDLTLLVCVCPPSGGSLLTQRYCRSLEKPFLRLDAKASLTWPTRGMTLVTQWLKSYPEATVLNVAGSRERSLPGIEQCVEQLIAALIEHLRA